MDLTMNAKQRRQNVRAFKHTVILPRPSKDWAKSTWAEMSSYDDKIKLAKGWLQWNTKRNKWRISESSWERTEFNFNSGPLAMAFALKFT
jgi:hypothetical protein